MAMSDCSALARRFFFGDSRTGIGDASLFRLCVFVAGDLGVEDMPEAESKLLLGDSRTGIGDASLFRLCVFVAGDLGVEDVPEAESKLLLAGMEDRG